MTPTEIRALRSALGLTQKEFGLAVGLEGNAVKDTVSKWERGRLTPRGPARRLMSLYRDHPELVSK